MLKNREIIEILQNTGARFSSVNDFDRAVELLSVVQYPKHILDYDKELKGTLEKIGAEVHRAKSIHTKNFHNLHEGYAVLKEEVDELWDEIKVNPNKENFSLFKIKNEAIQSAAMLTRFIIELC